MLYYNYILSIWLQEFKGSRSARLTYDNDTAKLRIEDVCIDDSGEYICAAVNEAGSVQTSCDLFVKGEQQYSLSCK